MKTKLILIAMLTILASCVGPTITEDGCVLFGYKDDSGNYYNAGLCAEDKYIVQWENKDNYILRVEKQNGEYMVKYKAPDSDIWLVWSSKCGVSLDGAPDNVKAVL